MIAALAFAGHARAGESPVAPLAARWLEHRLGRRPDLAVRLGASEVRSTGARARAVTATDTAWIAPLEREVRALKASRLSAEDALDRDLLLARLGEDRLELARERRFERDPGLPLRPLAGAIRATLEDPSRPAAERAVRASAWLAAVPEILRGTTAALRDPGSKETAAAAADARTLAQLLREGVPGYTEARAPGPLAELAVADTAAIAALVAFAEHLELDILPHATPAPLPDRDVVVRELDVWRSRSTPESLLERARREIAAHRRAMEAIATTMTGSPDVPAALAELDQDLVPADSLPVLVTATMEGLRRTLVEKKLLPAARVEPLRLERALWSAAGDPSVRLVASGAWSRRDRAALRLMMPARLAAPRVGRTDLILDVAAAGIPGRWSAELARRAAPSRFRQGLTLAFTDDAWALYAARLAAPLVSGADASRLELAWRARESRALARAAVHIAIALGADLDSESVELAAAGVPEQSARDEARRAAYDPAALGDVLALWRMLDLRAQTGSARPDVVHDAVIRMGIPLSSTTGVTIPGSRESRSQ
jgi:hypothetical protein